MSDLLVLLGHPDPQSWNAALADAYVDAARRAGASVALLRLGDLAFDPVLRGGFRTPMPLEPDLVRARAAIEAARHVTWIFPTWWGAPPALVKGFVDRLFLPGWAFRNRPGRPLPDKLLAGRSARIVTTMDSPAFWYALAHRASLHGSFEHATLDYVGFAPVRATTFYSVRTLDEAGREKALARLAKVAADDARRLPRPIVPRLPATP